MIRQQWFGVTLKSSSYSPRGGFSHNNDNKIKFATTSCHLILILLIFHTMVFLVWMSEYEAVIMENKTSFFTTYDQKENRVTNYCLLMLNQLYNYSPLLFNQILSNLTDELNFGVNFYQQQGINTKKGKQIADGIISQEPITIYVETKNFDWFYNNQIEGYLENLKNKNGKKFLLLLSNFDNTMEKINNRKNEIEQKYENDEIHIYPINFIDLYQEILHISNNIQNDMFIYMLNDFETFLLHENLLPIWKYRLDVVRTGTTMSENLKHNCYSCPFDNGTWKHKQAKYMGLLAQGKILKTIAEIDGVVDITKDNDSSKLHIDIEYSNIEDKISLINRARNIMTDMNYYGQKELEKKGLRLFLLSKITPLSKGFEKDSLGGRLPGKKYINLAKNWNNKPENISDVVNLIDGSRWSYFD